MHTVVTPQPHFIPGYTGHSPQLRFRPGKTYGKLSHKLLIDPCVNHAPDLIVSPTDRTARILEYPTQAQKDVLLERQRFVDAVYCDPIIPGYEGFVPNVTSKIGQRFLVAATAGMVEHENLMNLLRCKRRYLEHRDLLESGHGKFDPQLAERFLRPHPMYRAPLLPVKKRAQAVQMLNCPYREVKEPYSKFTTPHFMRDEDEEKYIISGYAGHIPLAAVRFGGSSKKLTNDALCEFSKLYHKRLRSSWCPSDEAVTNTWCPIDREAETPCPNTGHFVIYHTTTGVIPNYGGHVPGDTYAVGSTFGESSRNAKNWLATHQDKTKLY